MKHSFKRALSLVLALIMALGCMSVGAWATETTMTASALQTAIFAAENYVYDGNGVTVDLSSTDGLTGYRDNTNEKARQVYLLGDQNNAKEAAITIKNVKFTFDATTANVSGITHAQIYPYLKGDLTFENCEFNTVGMEVQAVYADDISATFTGCTFKNIPDNYAVKHINCKNFTFQNCTVENCGSGLLINSGHNGNSEETAGTISITGNTFKNVSDESTDYASKDRGVMQFSASFNPSTNTSVSITSNTYTSTGAAMRYLSTKGTFQDILFSGNTGITTLNYTGAVTLYSIHKNNTEYLTNVGPVAYIGDTKYETLAAAVAAASAGETVLVVAAGDYTLPNIPRNIMIKGGEGVEVIFSHTATGNIASIPNGATFENVTFNFGNPGDNYHGFQHAGKIVMNSCTIKGKFFSYADMDISSCTFYAPGSTENGGSSADYSMWVYGGGTVNYNNCSFYGAGKFLHLYTEGTMPHTVVVENCRFINEGAVKKAALNVKESCSNGNILDYDVTISDCTVEGKFPNANTVDDTATFFDGGLYMLDNRLSDSSQTKTKITLDGKQVYPKAAEPDYVAQIKDGQKYETLKAAVEAVEDGGTITLLRDVKNGSGIGTYRNATGLDKVGDPRISAKSFTIDFDGHTYTCVTPAVGSTKTETQGFHLEWNGNAENNVKVTLKNGTLTSAGDEVKMLIQNYCDLTLENMTLDGSNLPGAKPYTVSNNCGNVVINSSTVIAKSGAWAFDVCRYSSYPSVNVEVKGSSVINGNVEVYASGSDAKEGFSLTLTSGTLNGEIVLDNSVKALIGDDNFIANTTGVTLAAPAGYKWGTNGKLVAVDYVAEIGTVKYETLEEAFAAANDGDTITLLADCAGNGIKAPQGKFKTNGLTVDFANHTYTMDGAMVGSTGTETQAFQLLKDNTITFKNGTIYSEKALFLVQNYSNLTLDKMTLTLNNPNYASAYTLSNNNGNVVIKDSTINANPAGGFAFDVCRYASYPSVNVEVKGSSVIKGNVEVYASGNDAKDGFGLTLTSGTLNGDIVIDASAATAMAADAEKASITKAADFSATAPAGYKWDNNTTLTKIGENTVAMIGNNEYTSLEAAFAAANDGDTITLLADVALTDRVFVNAGAKTLDSGSRYATTSDNRSITLDLNGHEISGTSNIALAGGSLTVTGTGTISTSASGLAPIEVRGTGDLTAKRTLTIGENVTLSGACYGLNIFGSNDAQKNNIDVTVNGTVNGQLFVLGNLKSTNNAINIVVNGKISAPAATSGSPNPGIALNGYADVTVNNSASVTGDSGIEVRAGRLTVNGGTITGTASPTSVNANGSGTTSAGAGVAVAQHTTKLPITVTINGARLKGYTGLAISNPEKNNDGGAISVSMTNTNVVLNNGGTKEVSFIADANGVGAETRYGVTWDANDAISKIGTPAGYKVKTVDTIYMIEPIGEEPALASIGTTTYPTLAEAVTAAQNGDTITLLNKNVLKATVEFSGKTITLDLNGNNIEATDLRALHIKSGSVSIIGSGTIKTTHVEGANFSSSSSVIRVGDSNTTAAAASLTIGPRVTVSSNYCYGVTVFGENVANNAGYGQTLVVNGTVSVTGTASAISGNGNKDNSAVSTTINDGATVTAAADCAIYHPQAGKLAINGGTISGPTAIEIKAGQANVATSEVIVTGTPRITATGAANHVANGNGPSTCGYALAAVENAGYKGGVAISIAKGVFTGGKVAIEVDSESTSHPTISITGGTFINDVNEYCASGYAAAELTASTASEGEQAGWYKVGVVETTKATADLDGITDSSTAEQVAEAIENQVTSATESVSFSVQTSIKDEEANTTLNTTTASTVQLKKTKVETVETKQTVVTAGKLEGEKKAIAAVTLDQIKPGKLQEVLENAVASAGAKSSQVHTVDVAIVKDSEAGTMIREGDKVTKQSFEIHAEATAYVTTTNEQTTEKTTEAVGSYILPNSALKEGAQWSFNLPVHPDLVRVWNTGTNGVQYTTQLNHIETNETTGEETTTSKRLTVYANATDGYYTTIDNNSTYSTFELVLDELGGDDPTETPMGSASYGASLNLEDKVSINFYVTGVKGPSGSAATEKELANFKVEYSTDGRNTYQTLANGLSSTSTNKFESFVSCAAKELADEVYIRVSYNGTTIKEVTYSPQIYCERQITKNENAKLVSLCYALLEYGAYAQTRFNYNIGDLANKTYNIDAVPATVIDSEYNIAHGSGTAAGIVSAGASLTLESATQINFYFNHDSGYNASNYTISVKDANGAAVAAENYTVEDLGSQFAVRVKGIAAKNLDKAYTVTLDESRSVTYSALSYAYRMRNDSTESNICKALFNYYLAANAYFPTTTN